MKRDFKNQTIYIRETWNEEHPYTIISNHLIRDERLTATEKGLMLMTLSNHKDFIFNSTVLFKQSGLGKVEFNNSMKTLQNLGYLIKKPLNKGGYKWIIIESSLIFEDLQKIGYLKYDGEGSNWIINEEMESSLQLTDFHRKPENGNPTFQNPKNGNPKNGNPENRNPESQPIINTNNTNNKIGSSNNEEITNVDNNNVTLDSETAHEDTYFELEQQEVELKSDLNSPPQNSLPILLAHSGSFQNIINSSDFSLNDFNNYSDIYIAHIVLSCKLNSHYPQWAESHKSLDYNRKHYAVLTYACRSALEVNFETELKTQLITQSNLTERDLFKEFFGYYPDVKIV